MPAPRKQLRHVPVRLRVSVDPKAWAAVYGTAAAEVDADVRRYVVTLVSESAARRDGAIVAVRRDSL